MDEEWIGKAVSIVCDDRLGVFQGIINDISESQITIVRAFRNGVPLRKQDAEVTLRATDISSISIIPLYNSQSTIAPDVVSKPTPVKLPNFANAGNGVAVTSIVEEGYSCTPMGLQPPLWVDSSNSALTNQMSNIRISMNGPTCTPITSRAPSAQQLPYTTINGGGGSNKSSPPTSSNSSSVAQFFGNMIPPKVEVRMATTFGASSSTSASTAESYGSSGSKPIDILNTRGGFFPHDSADAIAASAGYSIGNCKPRGNGNSNGSGNGLLSRKQRKIIRRENSVKQNQTFATSVDDPLLHEDFDFEGNLALFNKQAIWNDIESEQKPDLVRHSDSLHEKKYRHDENILDSKPIELRQIETMFDGSEDFVTDEGLIIPTIPTFVRSKIELSADKAGLSVQRQTDILARGATDLAILLLGGARRLTPNNLHQWPKIVIICEKSDDNLRVSNIGAATGRQLASHGLMVLLYLDKDDEIEQKSNEIALFKATGNTVVYSVNALPTPDLVILSTNTANLSKDVVNWLNNNRASVLVIDPPTIGIHDVAIKYALLPILPLNGIGSSSCGKLYLCNLGIPDKFYRDAGIKYKSPFGHKFVIAIHSKD